MKRIAILVLGVVALIQAYSLTKGFRIEPRVEYDLGVVFLERWRGDYYLGVECVIPLEEYLGYQLKESIVEEWKKETKHARERKELAFDSRGLVPDIELPKLPVFGEGSRIDISGHDRITLGGRQTVLEGVVRTPGGGRLLPELKMEQQLAVKLNGTVGDRTKVNIDHDSERQESQNKIKLSYTGTDDDIVKSVELGDTRLSIPGTAYTGDLPVHKGLFGISTQGKLAGVDIYGIASQEQSQSQTQSFTGKRQLTVDTIYARDYARDRFYYIDVPDKILNLRVYVDDRNPANNQASLKAIATVYPEYPDSIPGNWSWDRDAGDFDLKTLGSDYVLYPGNILEFSGSLDPQDIVGMVVFTDKDTIGGEIFNDSLVLKLLKPGMPDSLSLTWDYEMRNVYALPRGEVQLSSVRLFRDTTGPQDAEYETSGPNNGRRFTEILGLDQNGDGRLEYPQFDSKTGLIRFPGAKPFASLGLSVRDSVIYRKDPLEVNEGRRYYMVVEFSSATESYYLGQVDIKEGSEKVRVNGELWTKGVGYDINYTTGRLSFLRALPPDADIRVTFEYRPWFSLSQKSLLGTRAEWRLGTNGKVGTSVFYRSEGIPGDKPVLGSESFRRTIAETDASYSISNERVSAFLDRLPLIRAQAPSKFSTALEGAISLPDPNTRGVAYLDDFEGTTITRDVSTNAILWYDASVPVGKDSAEFARKPLFWSTPLDRIRKDSVFGPSIGDEGRETEDYFRLVFTPDSAEPESWAGVMTCPSTMGMNLKDVENLQIILKSRRGRGNIHVSVGMSIDEDAPRRDRRGKIVGLNGRLDTEDRNGNGILDRELEDTGLDTVFCADSLWGPDSADDGNDDYDVGNNPGGTEDNGRLDAEDLDRSGFSRYNHYFECEIPLGDERYLATDLYHGWQLYRVSLHDTSAFETVGVPKWENIKLVRVWFDGFCDTDTIDFYSIEFVGSKWHNPRIVNIEEPQPPSSDTNIAPVPDEHLVPPDTSEQVWVAQISKKTDTSYIPPFELKKDVYGRVEQEASLLFGYRGFCAGHRAVVEKACAEHDDYRDYDGLHLYVHDDGNGFDFLMRIGADSTNYYEFCTPITQGKMIPGRDGKWFEFVVALDSFPLMKLRRDSFGDSSGFWTNGRYGVKGYPSLADIRYTALGIENCGSVPASGGVWFDDMRLTGPRRDQGYGFQARADVSLSDLASMGVSFSYSDPNFRRFSEGRGVKTGGFGTNFGTNVRANLDRLLPHSWGFSIPLSYSISRQQDLPKFSATYPDLRLNRKQGAADVATARSQDIGLNNVHKQRSGNRVLNYTIEAMSASWRRHEACHRTALTNDSSWSRALQWSYNISPDINIGLGEDNELYLFPQGIRFGLSNGERLGLRGSRQTVADSFRVDTLRSRGLGSDFGLEYSPIEDLSFEYGIGSERDLLVSRPDTLWFLSIGSEASQDENFGASYSTDIGDFLSPSLDFDGDYSHDCPKEDSNNYAHYRNMENSGDLDLSLGIDLPELLDRFGTVQSRPKDTTKGSNSRSSMRRAAGALSRVLDPLDFDYSVSRSSELIKVSDSTPASWSYRLGFSDAFTFDSLNPPSSIDRELQNSFKVSSAVRIRQLRAGFGYDWSLGRNVNVFTTTVDRSVSWPDLDVSLGKVHNLFPKLATDSKLSGRYRRRHNRSGELSGDTLVMYGRTDSYTNEFNPLVSWQTTWKRKISTTLSANYSLTAATDFLSETGENRNVSNSDNRGGDLSFSYSFSAPKGLRLPFLKRVRFSSDLRLTWSLGYSQTTRSRTQWTAGIPEKTVPQQHDNSLSTKLAGSYSFSRTIEAGTNIGYSHTKGLSGTATKTTDLNIWVLFRF